MPGQWHHNGGKVVSFRTNTSTEIAWLDKFNGNGWALQFPTGTGASYILHPANLLLGRVDLTSYVNIFANTIDLGAATIRGPAATVFAFQSGQPDSGSAANAYVFDTQNALTSTRRIASFKNKAVEKAFIDFAGNLSASGTVTAVTGGSTNHAVCWKTGGTLGFCSVVVDASGICGTCN